jgi:hypothetical protein
MNAAEQLQAAADRRAEWLAKALARLDAAKRAGECVAENPRAERNLKQFKVTK